MAQSAVMKYVQEALEEIRTTTITKCVRCSRPYCGIHKNCMYETSGENCYKCENCTGKPRAKWKGNKKHKAGIGGGATTGAGVGAAIGIIGGPVGMAVGAGVGFILGGGGTAGAIHKKPWAKHHEDYELMAGCSIRTCKYYIPVMKDVDD